MNFLQALPDGWTIYVWLIAGGLIIFAAVYGIRWAYKNEQFDEDVKYLVFDENDKDKMSPEEYAKSREVMARQIKRREEVQREKAQQANRRHEER